MVKTKDKKLIIELINKYINELKKRKIDIVSAYLFGSYAKGKPTEWSDIDVAVITKNIVGDDNFDFKFLLMKIARDIDYNIEPHPYLTDEFNENNPAAAEIMRTGEKVI